MKKIVFLVMAILLGAAGIKAQKVEEFGIFDHLGVGVSVGTTGIGFDVSAPVTDYLQLRAGYSFMPKLAFTTGVDLDTNVPMLADEVEVEGKLNLNNFKLLVDIYPFKASKSAFHLTAGAYIGSENLISIYNTKPFLANPSDWGNVGIELGDYNIPTDKEGNIRADLKVNSFKPYLGIGYGRAIPKKRLAMSLDMGVQFWGTPSIYTNAGKLTKEDFGDGEDTGEFFDILEKITVYPVIKLRICGRIF